MRSGPMAVPGLLLALLVLLGSAAPTAFARESDVHPKSIQAVKIKHPGGDGDIRLGNCKYQTGIDTRSYASVIGELDQRGVRHVFIKYPVPGKQVDPDACDHPQIRAEILKILGAMKDFNTNNGRTPDNSMRAWVFHRQWLWDDTRTSQQRAALYDEFINEMSTLINQAGAQNVRNPLEGIAPIETQLPGSQKVREFALNAARDINDNTGDWLKTHTLLFPGSGNGSWFKNIDIVLPGGQKATQFFDDIKREVKYFAFIYKFMKSHDGGVTATIEPYYYPEWADIIRGPNQDFATQKSYIEDQLGFGDLRTFINDGRDAGHTWVANAVFWGDSGDGMTQMFRTNVQLMHQLLVEDQQMDQPGYVFDFAINDPADPKECDPADPEDCEKNLARHLLLDEGTAVTTNTRNAWNERGPGDTMTVWEEWFNWRLNPAGY